VEPRKPGDDVLGDAIAENRLVRLPAEIVEGKDGDRGSIRQRKAWRFDGLTLRPSPDANGARNVLELLVSGILPGEIELAGDVFMDPSRDGDPPGLGQGLQTGGNIDPIAIVALLIADDLALVDTDAELDTPRLGYIGVARPDQPLNVGRGMDCTDDTAKLGEDAVAGRIDDVPAMLLNERQQRRLVLLHRADRPLLVLAEEAAVAGDVGCQDRGQASIHFVRASSCSRLISAG
jgi:hypothetical protein